MSSKQNHSIKTVLTVAQININYFSTSKHDILFIPRQHETIRPNTVTTLHHTS